MPTRTLVRYNQHSRFICSSDTVVKNFFAEAQILARASHTRIARMTGVFMDYTQRPRRMYIEQRLYPGGTLDEWSAKHPRPSLVNKALMHVTQKAEADEFFIHK